MSCFLYDTPISRVPTEVWTTIFQEAKEYCNNSTPSVKKPPLSLTHVCTSWRNIAISYPWLWDSIDIRLRSKEGTTKSVPKENLIELWLDRARHLPIDITVDDRDDEARNDMKIAQTMGRLTSIVTNKMPQWRNVKFEVSLFWSEFDALYEQMEMPYIESVTLDERVLEAEHPAFESACKVLTAIGRAPLLSHLTVTSNRCQDTENSPLTELLMEIGNHTFKKVTHLHLKLNIAPDVFLRLLESAENLECGVFTEITKDSDPSGIPKGKQIFLPNLVQLVLCTSFRDFEDFEGTDLSTILATLRAPALVDLEFGYDDFLTLETVASFVKDSGCKMERFAILTCKASDVGMLACLVAMPLLEELIMDFQVEYQEGIIISEAFCEALQAFNSTETGFELCPNLERVHVNCKDIEDFGELFAEMVRDRLDPIFGDGHLETVVLRGLHEPEPPEKHPEQVQYLYRLQGKRGLEIEYSERKYSPDFHY